jgi:PKD repeat protein
MERSDLKGRVRRAAPGPVPVVLAALVLIGSAPIARGQGCPPGGLTLTPATLPAGTVGVPYNQVIATTNGAAPVTFDLPSGNLPPGMRLATDGTLSGTPTTGGAYTFTVRATDKKNCTGSMTYTLRICSTITVAPATLPGGVAGTAYSQTLTASGGTAPYSFAVTTGAIPPGTTLSSAGALTGTPTAAGTFNFTVTATDANACTGSQSYSITVTCPAIALAPAALPAATGGAPYSQTITASGGTAPYAFSVSAGNLPPGITLSPGGVLSGTSVAGGTYNFTIAATDADGCRGTRAYTLTVSCPPITISPATVPGGTVGTPYSQTLSAAGGVGPYGFAVTSGALPAGLTLSAGGVLSGTPTAAGTSNFVVTATDADNCSGTRNYSITISAAPCPTITLSPASLPGATAGSPYSQTISASGGTPPYSFALSSGALPPGLTLAASGALTGTPTTSGTFNFTVSATDAAGCIGSRGYAIIVSPPPCPTITLAPPTLPGGTVGTAYSQSVSASGGAAPYTFSVVGGTLPAGLSLSAAGALTGTPTATGTFNFTIGATDSNHCAGSGNYAVTISPAACPTVTVNPASLPQGTLGTPYNQTLSASGGAPPFTFSVASGSLPGGLTLSSAGALSGTPTAAGVFNFVVTATDVNGCTGNRSYSVTIGTAPCPAISISPATLPDGVAGTAYNQSFSASGGAAPYTFAIQSGSPPSGLTLTTSGLLSGFPSAPGAYSFLVSATDRNGCIATASYTITISCPSVVLQPAALPAGSVGTPYAVTLTASGSTGPYTFSIASGALPPGLSLSTTGALAGIPTSATTSAFTVIATSATGCQGSAAYTLAIGSGGPAITALNPGSAAAGGPAFTLRVSGTGFEPTSVVQWNGAARQTQFVSSTELDASIPASDIVTTGSVPVTVLTPGRGTSNVLSFTISSTCQPPGPPGNPTIVPADHPTDPVTGVDFLRLSWSPPATGGAPSRYEWALNGDAFVSAGTDTSVVIPPRGRSDPLQLHVRAVGCAPGPAADSPVYSPQAPAASFSASGPVAPGATVTFTDTSDPQATSWLWLFGDGQIATTQSVVHTFTAAGTYSVVLIASNGAGSSMAVRSQVVQSETVTAGRATSTRPFEAGEAGRQRLDDVRLAGPRKTWLHASAPGAEDETILYLRFLDDRGRLVLERRLSIAPGEEAVFDVGAFGIRGDYSLEAVSARDVRVEIVETGPPGPVKWRLP